MIRATASDIEALRAALAVAEARAEEAVAKASNAEAIIAALKLMVEKLRREVYGQRSERKARLLDQLELELEELEARAREDELAAEQAAAKTSTVKSFTRRRPSRKPFPEHLPRERVVVPAPEVCGCCGSDRLSKLGEDITETLEVIPRSWKVVQTVREKFTCRGLREDLASPRTVPCDPAGLGGSEPAGHDPVREVWPTSAVEPAERALWPRGRGAQPVDPGRPGGRLYHRAATAPRLDRGPCAGRRAHSWRRHHGAGAGEGQDRHGAGLGLCARTMHPLEAPIRWRRVLLLRAIDPARIPRST